MMEIKLEIKGVKFQGKGGSMGDNMISFGLDDFSYEGKAPESLIESTMRAFEKAMVIGSMV